MLLVYPERLGWAIGEEVFKQLASVFNFRVRGGKIRREFRISIASGRTSISFSKKLAVD